MITDTIQKQINEAMKKGDEIRLSTLRLLSAALTNAEIEKKREKLTKDSGMRHVISSCLIPISRQYRWLMGKDSSSWQDVPQGLPLHSI